MQSCLAHRRRGGLWPATGRNRDTPTRIDRVHVESQHVDYDLASKVEGSEIRAVVQFPAADVWQALQTVYSDLSIPIETNDPTHRFLAGVVSARRAFANKPLSRLVDCGSTAIGPNANTYNVGLHLQTQVDSLRASETTLRTLLRSTAASDGGITIRCSSSGELERSIVDRTRALLIQGTK